MEIHHLLVLEARSPRSGLLLGLVPSGTGMESLSQLSPGFGRLAGRLWCSRLYLLWHSFCVCLCVQISPSRRTAVILD